MHHRIDVGPRLVDLAVDEALAIERHAVVLGIDGVGVESSAGVSAATTESPSGAIEREIR